MVYMEPLHCYGPMGHDPSYLGRDDRHVPWVDSQNNVNDSRSFAKRFLNGRLGNYGPRAELMTKRAGFRICQENKIYALDRLVVASDRLFRY